MIKWILILLAFATLKAEAQNTSAFAVADSLLQIGAYSQAIQQYKILEDSPIAMQKIAQAYQALGSDKQAIHYYTKVLLATPNNFAASYKLGSLLRSTGDYQRADSLFSSLNTIHPNKPSVLYQLGYVKEQLKDSTAIIYYSQAYLIDNNQQNALYRLAKLLLEKRYFTQAKENIDLGLAADSQSTRFVLLNALSYYVNKSYHDAITNYQLLLDLGRDTEQIREQLAMSFAQTFQYEAAIPHFLVLINTYDDKNPSWHYNLGKCYMGVNDFEKAREHINMSIQLLDVPLDAQYVSLAIMYNREGDFKQVISHLQRAIEENPLNETAIYQLAIAADNYYEDRLEIISLYQNYLNLFQDRGRYHELVKARLADLKKEDHLSKD